MTAESEEIHTEVLHIHLEMRHTLRAIGQEVCAMGMGQLRHLADGIDGAEHVAHVGHTDKAGALIEQRLVGCHIQIAVVVHRNDAQDDAQPVAQHLPRHNVGMVLHNGEYHLVALVQESASVTVGHEIEALGGAAREDYLLRLSRVDEAAHLLAGCLVEFGGLLREVVHTAVHVGVRIVVFLADGVNHGAGFLRRGGVVQINQWAAVHLSAEDGKISSHIHI